MDGLKQFATIAARIDTINKAHNIDSIGKLHGIEMPAAVAGNIPLGNLSPDSATKIFSTIVGVQTKIFSMPEVAPAFTGMALTPAQYAWTRLRFRQAWQVTSMMDQMKAQGIPAAAIHFNHPGVPDADIAFTSSNDAEIRALLGLPALTTAAASTPGALETHANPTVTLNPANGPLATLLPKEIADAKAKGELPIVEISDHQVCAPCIILDKAMERPALVETFKNVRLIKLSPVAWGAQLPPFNFCRRNGNGDFSCDMPHFFAVGADGKATSEGLGLTFTAGDPDGTAKALAPQFAAFLAPLRTAKP